MMLATLALVLTSAQAPAPDTMVQAELACGAGRFRLRSWMLPRGPDSSASPVAQAMTVQADGRTRALPVRTEGSVRVGGRRVQRAFISSWACLGPASGAHYVQLEYGCALVPDPVSACSGGDEWFPLLNDHGRVVDTGIPNGGPPTPALRARLRLERRLGLSRSLAKGIEGRSVTGFP